MTSNSNITETNAPGNKQDNKEDNISQNDMQEWLLSTKHGWWSSTMAKRIPWERKDDIKIPNFTFWKRRLDGETVPVTIITSDGSTVCPYGSTVTDAIYLGELDGNSWEPGCKSPLDDANAIIKRLYGTTQMASIPSFVMTSDSKDTDTSSQLEKKSDTQQEQKSANPKVNGWWSSEMAARPNAIGQLMESTYPPTSIIHPTFYWRKRICDGKTIPVTCITSDGSTVCPYHSSVSDAIYLGELDGDSLRYGQKNELDDANAMIKRLYGTTKMASIPSGTNTTSEEAAMTATSEKTAITPVEPKDLHGDN